MTTYALVRESLHKLRRYVEQKNFRGWDPYDGLNSKIFQSTFLRHLFVARLAWIQLFKRSPLNLRRILFVNEDYNAKGLALFLSGYIRLYRLEHKPEYHEKILFLVSKIREVVSPGYSGACWGYNFDWQARAFFQPKGTPTVVATTYVACALLDYYEMSRDQSILQLARSSCDFVLKDLHRTYDQNDNFCFSYSPLDQTQVFNASLLGSRLLARVYAHTGETPLKDAAEKSVAFCCAFQQENGAWPYGTLPFHSWIDNFHTGFNLECLFEYQRCCRDERFSANLAKGLSFYLENFFTEQGESKYYHNKMYPIDIHGPAQLVVTLGALGIIQKQKALADRVLTWTINNMSSTEGYFYYQLKPGWSSKVPYIRWAQAWMFYSMSYYIAYFHEQKEDNPV